MICKWFILVMLCAYLGCSSTSSTNEIRGRILDSQSTTTADGIVVTIEIQLWDENGECRCREVDKFIEELYGKEVKKCGHKPGNYGSTTLVFCDDRAIWSKLHLMQTGVFIVDNKSRLLGVRPWTDKNGKN